MLVLAAATALALTPSIVDAPHAFATCAAAVAYATKAPEVGQLTYQLRYGYSRAPQFSRNGKVLFRTHIAIAHPVITLPQWTWPNATVEQAKNFAEFQANVLRHEQGHWALARDYIKKRDATEWLPESMTREQAAAHFKIYFDTMAAGLQDAQNFYDSLTDHGRSQQRAAMFGLGGGDDTILSCE